MPDLTDDEENLLVLVRLGEVELDEFGSLYETMYDYYFEEMPYGVAKARDGDPYEWLTERIIEDF